MAKTITDINEFNGFLVNDVLKADQQTLLGVVAARLQALGGTIGNPSGFGGGYAVSDLTTYINASTNIGWLQQIQNQLINMSLTAANGANLWQGAANAITAFAGGGQTSATVLKAGDNRVTTCATAADSVILPPNAPGVVCSVTNDGAQSLNVFPDVGAAIDQLSANTAFAVPPGYQVVFRCHVANVWRSMGMPVRALYSNVAASTAVTNTTTETLFDKNFSIPANTLKVGSIVKIKFQGIATATNSTDTLQIKCYIGGLTGTALLTSSATDATNNDVFAGEVTLVVRTIGASGTFVATGSFTKVEGASGTATRVDAITASTTIDTTAAQVAGVSATWSVANAGNSCRLDVMTVEVI